MSDAAPTSQHEIEAARQRQALAYLRDYARAAHREGDGMLVQHLCTVALRSLIDLANAGTLRLSLRETYWAPVLQLYWLHRDYPLMLLRHEIWPKLSARETPENEVRRCVDALLWMVEQPLTNGEPVRAQLSDLTLDWITGHEEIEAAVLLTFLAELLWHRNTDGPSWRTFLTEWQQRAPEHLRTLLSQTAERLRAQTVIASPESTSSGPEELSDSFVPEIQTLHRLWLAALRCDFARVEELRESLVPRLSGESWAEDRAARIIFDFHRATGAGTAVREDPQELGLTRRLLLTAGVKGHAVSEARDANFAEEFAEVLRGGVNAHKPGERFHCFRLAMLKELAALREWDYANWVEALDFGSACFLEAAHADPSLGFLAAQGIDLAVQARGFQGRKDLLTRAALLALDRAPVEARERLVRRLLRVHPLQRYDALTALAEISDAIPEPLMAEVAEWCVQFVVHDSEKLAKARGSTAAPLAMWRHILGRVDGTADLCRHLFPAFLKEAANSRTWFGDAVPTLGRFLQHADESNARAILDVLTQTDAPEDVRDFERWRLVYNALFARPELRDARYLELLRKTAHKPLRAHYLRRFDEGASTDAYPSDPALTIWLRELLLKRDFTTNFDGITIGWLALVRWTEAEIALVDQMIGLIDDPRCSCWLISSSLACLAEIVDVADRAVITRVQPALERWLRQSPTGQNRNQTSPFSVQRNIEPDQNDVDDAVAQLALAILRAGGEGLLPAVQRFVARLPAVPCASAVPSLAALACDVASRSDETERSELLATARALCQVAFALAETEPDWMTACARTLVNLHSVFEEHPNLFSAEQFEFLYALLPTSASLSDPMARATAAELISWFVDHGKADATMEKALETLRNDPRARVRHRAKTR